MRIQYKGGVWKNSEDEILKAAVMKYGMNQWARIASLLVRKSAKQCKARWFEWLDPSIKKTEWTREEEEKLLHLAKIMPTSWRTIAPMIGRTAAQCLEHYQKLLDQAQIPAEADGSGPSSSAAASATSKVRPGELDPTPETRPARPDPVDMDEDELEMLSEARARLANTKGKKAKRKARENQLEVAKRLAQLQKRRELKAAGVELKPRRKNRKVTDYAMEIPFERAPAPGFYDTREEVDRAMNQSKDSQIGKLIQKYKGKSAEELEEEAKKRDSRKKKLEKVNIPAALGLEKLAEPLSPPLKKTRISLPAPQVSDYELEVIAKRGIHAGVAQDAARRANGGESLGPPQVATQHIGDSVPRVAQTQTWASVRQQQVQTIASMHSAQTPLRGGPNTPLLELGVNGTVNPIRTDLTASNPLATPLAMTNDSNPATQETRFKQAEKEKNKRLQDTVKTHLRALPEPENEYEIEVDETLLNGYDAAVDDEDRHMVEDAEDEKLREEGSCAREIEEQKKRLLSSVAKRNLPIPKLKADGNLNVADYLSWLIRKDVATHDALSEYVRCDKPSSEALGILRSMFIKQDVTEEDLANARELVRAEMEKDEETVKAFEKTIYEALDASA